MTVRKAGITSTTIAVIAALMTVLAVSSPADAATYPYKPPSSFKVTKTSNTALSVSWKTPSSAVKSFAIQASTSSSFSTKKTTIVNNGGSSVQMSGLSPDRKYYLRVRGRNSSKDLTDWSSVITKYTSTFAFSPPSTPVFSRMRRDSFKLAWGEVPNGSSFRIQLSTKSNFTGTGDPSAEPGGPDGTPIYLYTGADNSAYIGRGGTVKDKDGAGTETLIKPNQTYYVRVRALEAKTDGSGDVYDLTNYSGTRSAKTSETWTSYAPDDFKAVSAAKNEIVLSWTDIDQQSQPGVADSYRLQQWTGSTMRYLDTGTLVANDPRGSVTRSGNTWTARLKQFCNGDTCSAFTGGTAYSFRVSSWNGAVSVSDYTDPAGVKVVGSAYALPTPDDFRVDGVTDKTVSVSWTAVAGASSYRLQQKLGSTSGTTRYLYDVCRPGGPACTEAGGRIQITLDKFTDNNSNASTTIGSNQTYYLRVIAQTPPNDGANSFETRASEYNPSYLKATTKGWPFDAPENFVSSSHDGNSITMKWDPAPTTKGPVRYRIQYSKNSLMTSASYKTTTIDDVSTATISGLAEETTYYFRIRVINPTDTATYSDYTAVTAPSTVRTTSPRGSVAGTLNVPAGCDIGDYRLGAYWGDDLAGEAEVTPGTSTFRINLLRLGAYKLQYAYVGQGNCVSPWVSTNATYNHESHVLKSKSSGYSVTEDATTPLGTTTAAVGATVTGTVRNTAGAPLGSVFVTAYGAPEAASDSYREVQALIATDTDGTYTMPGLWPGKKYKFYFASLGGSYKAHDFWVNSLGNRTNDPVTLCNSTQSGCVSSPEVD